MEGEGLLDPIPSWIFHPPSKVELSHRCCKARVNAQYLMQLFLWWDQMAAIWDICWKQGTPSGSLHNAAGVMLPAAQAMAWNCFSDFIKSGGKKKGCFKSCNDWHYHVKYTCKNIHVSATSTHVPPQLLLLNEDPERIYGCGRTFIES